MTSYILSYYLFAENFISGVFWIPYTLFMAYLFYENFSAKRYPQYGINLFLLASTLFRCIWLLIFPWYASEMAAIIINRVAILCQFSGISILVMMWLRALTFDDRKSQVPDGNNEYNRDHSLVKYNVGLLLVNLTAWVSIIGTAAASADDFTYFLNSCLLAVVCFVEAVIVLVASLKTADRIKDLVGDVQPRENTYNPVLFVWNAILWCRDIYNLIYFPRDAQVKYRAQRKVLRTFVSISTIMFTFFAVRCFCFVYIPFYKEGSTEDLALYPFFYYQFPELFPNLAIVRGISPPYSIIRNIKFRYVKEYFFPKTADPSNNSSRVISSYQYDKDQKASESDFASLNIMHYNTNSPNPNPRPNSGVITISMTSVERPSSLKVPPSTNATNNNNINLNSNNNV